MVSFRKSWMIPDELEGAYCCSSRYAKMALVVFPWMACVKSEMLKNASYGVLYSFRLDSEGGICGVFSAGSCFGLLLCGFKPARYVIPVDYGV